MNQIQENKNSSFLGCEDLFDKNAVVIATLPPFAECVTAIKQNRVMLDPLIARRAMDQSGTSVNKKLQHDAVIISAIDVSNRLMAYATVTKNAILLKEAKVTKSVLDRLADTRLKATIQGLLDLAIANAGDTLAYGITPEVTSNLAELLEVYSGTIPQPRLSIDEAKQLTTEISQLFKSDDELFKTTDALIKLFKDSHPEFYNSYTNLRKVIPSGKGTRALQLLVKDAVTGQGLPKVKLVIEASEPDIKAAKAAGADLQKSVKITSAKGGINAKNMADGNYTVTASRADYATQVVNFTIVGGIMTNVVIEMGKE